MSTTTGMMFAVKAAFSIMEAAQARRDQQTTQFDFDWSIMQLPATHPHHLASAVMSADDYWTRPEDREAFVQRHLDTVWIDPELLRVNFREDADPDDVVELYDELKEYFPNAENIDLSNSQLSANQFAINRWASDDAVKRRRANGITMLAGMALKFMSTYTHRMGLRPQAQNIVSAITSGLANHIEQNRAEIAENFFSEGMPKRIAETLLKTSLEVAEGRPELFSDEKSVQLAVRAFVSPLAELNRANAGQDYNPGERLSKIRETLRGPVAVGLLQTLYEQRREIFDDDYPDKESAAGIVSDAMFQALVDQAATSGSIYGVVTPSFFQRAYPTLMQAVAESPESFIRGRGDHVELGKEFLGELMNSLRPVSGEGDPNLSVKYNSDLLRSIFDTGISLTRKHARNFLTREAREEITEWAEERMASADKPWALLQINLVSHIANDMIDGFAAKGIDPSIFTQATEREFLLELVGLVAEQVSLTPGLLVGDDAKPEVVNIARGVAKFVSGNYAKLLTRADWQLVSAKAVELALENPGKLFGIDEVEPDDALAVMLIEKVLGAAHESLSSQAGGEVVMERKSGQVLFGRTLSQALIATLELAVSNARQIKDPQSIAAITLLVQRLNGLASEAQQKLSSKDWLLAFRWFANDVVDTGAFEFSDAEILDVLAKLRSGKIALPAENKPSKQNSETARTDQVAVAAATVVTTAPARPVTGLRHPAPAARRNEQEIYYTPVSAKGAEG